MELIDKAAVVASLTERLKSLQKEYNELVQDEFWETARDVAPKINEIQKTISLISNFRRKEMDSVKEMIDYKQKYEEALSRAKYLKENTDSIGALDVSACFEKIFPELAKSEDELIREEIIDCFVGMKKQGCFPSKHEEQYDSWISWLEKQGEQKPVEDPKQKWSSEDESRFACLLGILNWVEKSNYSSAKNVGEYIHWLQSLKQRLNGDELSSNENK